MTKMEVTEMPVDSIRPYENNPRNNEPAVEKLANCIREFGWRQPIVVDADGVIVCGHTRYYAALKLGLATVPVHVAHDLTPEKVTAYRLADNKVAEIATWDFDKLDEELKKLGESGIDLQSFGFEKELAELEPPANLDGEDAEKPFMLKLTFKTADECEKFLDEHRQELDALKVSVSVGGGGL